MIFHEGELRDSIIYIRIDDLILEEHHYDIMDEKEWHVYREYDAESKLIRQVELPDNFETVYVYDGSRLIKTIFYNHGKKSSGCEYFYSRSGNKEIVECGYNGNIGMRSTYINGNIIEQIVYHPTFQGSEWYCYRYEYY